MATVSEEELDTKLKSLQGFIEAANSGRYPKRRYIKTYTESDIPNSRFEYSFNNLLCCYSLFGTALSIIQYGFSSELLKIWHDYHSAEQEQDVPKLTHYWYLRNPDPRMQKFAKERTQAIFNEFVGLVKKYGKGSYQNYYIKDDQQQPLYHKSNQRLDYMQNLYMEIIKWAQQRLDEVEHETRRRS